MPYAADWVLENPAVSIEEDSGATRALSLEHASYPYVEKWKPGPGSTKTLKTIAGAYLGKVKERLGLRSLQIDAQTGKICNQLDRLQLTWLPIDGSESGIGRAPPDARLSFWVRRKVGTTAPYPDLSVVLLAAPTLFEDDESSVIGARSGLRINARVVPGPNDWQIGITGIASSAGLAELIGPAGPEVPDALAKYL